ncbi:MAG TPA: tubulin-like doman-containing protein [Ktedonobacteraceae bacterium]|nr:tubulin-like doman-containing protein [Ktedonobacteraceae bacterium]
MQQTYDEPLLESERPSTTASSRILTPNLVILLGSTSAIAGLELMRHMLSLKASDQRRVALVYIDTDDPPAPLVEFRRQHNNVFLEFPLRIAVPAGISSATPSDQHTFIQERIPQYFANGAGGIRNNGHVAACFNYQYIYDVLDRAVIAISRLSTEQNVSKVREIQANIVAFLGGGTGSGILTDIAVMVRDILIHRLFKQRLNLFCMLPEPISGATVNDLRWRKSNATASLLEVLAYSRAAAPTPNEGYKKYMRGKMHRLTNDPIANEVYLLGHASMDDAGDTARIVGLDLFQRTTDASGVGFLEHSKWVDRRTLGAEDDRHLPTMFGTSCPLEVRFPAEETALAYAQVSASQLLPLLASYQPSPVRVGDPDKQEWHKKWRMVARLDANISDPLTIKIDEFRPDDFENAAQAHLDLLWNKLIRNEQTTEARIKELIELKRQEEQGFIRDTPPTNQEGEQSSLINRRIQHLHYLQQEYEFMLAELKEREAPRVPSRPSEMEAKLTRQPNWPGPLRMLGRDYASALTGEYNDHLHIHARAVRHQLLTQLFKELRQQVQFALEQSMTWFYNTGATDRTKELFDKGRSSMAWNGKLDYSHPHQRHLFDLDTLRTQNDHNVAAERLYYWATGGEQALQSRQLDFQQFVSPCVDYIMQHTPSGEKRGSIDRQVAGRLAERVVDFFREYYLGKFADRNLFDLLFLASPAPRSGQTRSEQVSSYFLQHMQHMRGLMSSLVAFEAELWQEGLSTLDTSVYLGIHWHDGMQEDLLHQTLEQLGSVTSHGQLATINRSLDPHRLQVAYGQHAISISTVRDFYLEQNSAMEYYLEYQRMWHESNGKGLMPVHSSGEAERLVIKGDALGYGKPLVELIIRSPHTPHGSGGPGGPGPGGNGSGSGSGGNGLGGSNGQTASSGPKDNWDL